jgi:hypothetical protein
MSTKEKKIEKKVCLCPFHGEPGHSCEKCVWNKQLDAVNELKESNPSKE